MIFIDYIAAHIDATIGFLNTCELACDQMLRDAPWLCFLSFFLLLFLFLFCISTEGCDGFDDKWHFNLLWWKFLACHWRNLPRNTLILTWWWSCWTNLMISCRNILLWTEVSNRWTFNISQEFLSFLKHLFFWLTWSETLRLSWWASRCSPPLCLHLIR